MAKKKKFYAVRAGNNIGIFNTWAECESSVNGFREAQYKSFENEDEAKLYLEGKDSIILHRHKAEEINGVVAYVDGSFSVEKNRYSFGCVVIGKEGKIHSYYGYGDNPVALEINNIAGELQGTMYAVKWAYENEYKNILIKHDYEGISKWCNKEWKAKNTSVKEFVNFIEEYKQNIKIDFEKVTGHSGDKYNEEADRLAKTALECGRNISKGDTWIKVDNITSEDISIIIDVITEDIKEIQVSLEPKAFGKMYRLKLPDEYVVIKMYEDKKRVLIQGKFGIITSTLLSSISELIDISDMNEIRNQFFNINIDKNIVTEQFEGYLINSAEFIPEKISRVLHQAVYNLNIVGDMYDASFLVYPALRGLEGIIKLILEKHKIDCSNGFKMFKQRGKTAYILDEESNKRIGSPKKIGHINRLYTHYHKQRHPISHWNDPTAMIDDTKIITDCNTAHTIIKDTLQLIDEYYKIS